MARKRASRSATRDSDRLLQRIRTLVQQSNGGDGSDGATVRAHRREIEQLQSQLAELVKRNPTGLDDPPAGADPEGAQR